MDNNAGGLGSTPTPDNSKSPVVQPPATGGGVVSPATASAPSANLENSAATAASTPVEGAIFSGPTAANSLSGTGQPDQETAERARQFFAHHPAHTYSREMGDIVIGGETKPKKMNKKPLIIGGIALGVVVVAIVIFLVVTAGSKLRNAFVGYANYLITGVDSTDTLSPAYEYPGENRVYTIIYEDGETLGSYFAALDILADDLLLAADDSPEFRSQIYALVESVWAWQQATTFYSTQEAVIAAYIDAGSVGVEQYANELYSPLLTSDIGAINEIGNALTNAQSERGLLYDLISEQGCNLTNLTEACAEIALDLELTAEPSLQSTSLVERAQRQASEQLNNVLPTIWQIAIGLGLEE